MNDSEQGVPSSQELGEEEIDLEPFRSPNTTGYRGVYWKSSMRKYNAQIKQNYANKHLGYFATVEEAARAHARAYLSQHGGPPAPTAPSAAEQFRQEEEGEEEIDLEPFRSEKSSSGYRGVSWNSPKRKYKAQIWVNDCLRHLGYFDTAEEAARAYARAYLREYGGQRDAMPLQEVPSVVEEEEEEEEEEEVENKIATKMSVPGAAGTADAPQPQRMPDLQNASLMAVNNSQQGGPSSSQEPGEEEMDLEPIRSPNSSAGYRAVYWHVYWMSSVQKYNAKINVNGVNRSLGLFDTAEEAARAYARAYLIAHGGPSAPPAPSVAEQFRQEEEGEEEIDLEQFRSEKGSSGYRGVSWNICSQKYQAQISQQHLGYFDTVEQAAKVYARAYLREHGVPSVPPVPSAAEQFRQKAEGEEEIDLEPFRSTNTTGYRGVYWNSSNRQFQAQICMNRNKTHLGYFDTAAEAARAYARSYLSEHGVPSTLSLAEQFRQEEEGEEEIDLEPFRSEKSSSGYRGVCWHTSHRKYKAQIRMNGASRHLGLFDTATEAAQAYARAYLREHGGPSALSLAEQFRQEAEGAEEASSSRPAKRARVATAAVASTQAGGKKCDAAGEAAGVAVIASGGSTEDATTKANGGSVEAQGEAGATVVDEAGAAAADALLTMACSSVSVEEIDLEPFRSEKSNSGYRGVSWNSSKHKYQAQIRVNGVNKHLGLFDTAEEAAQAYARAYLREHGGPPDPSALSATEQFRQEEGEEEIDLEPFRSERSSAGYRGVCWHTSHLKYKAQITVHGRKRHLGHFDTANEAAQAFAKAYVRQTGGPPAPSVAEQFRQEEEGEEEIDLELFRSEKNSSGYKGVRWNSSNQKYQARIRVNGVNRSLGYFDTAEEAAQAYARAHLRQHEDQLMADEEEESEEDQCQLGGLVSCAATCKREPKKREEEDNEEEDGEEDGEEIDLEPFRSTNSAGYRGVRWNSNRKKYQALIWVNGHRRSLGCFDTPNQAARAYARAYLRQHGGPPAPNWAEKFRQEEEGEEIDLEPFRSEGRAGYRGVCWDSGKRKYKAQICVNGDRRHLGSFDTAEEAARAHARAYLREYGGPSAQAGLGTMPQKKAQASSESDENEDDEEEASSSLRPAKRARVATAE